MENAHKFAALEVQKIFNSTYEKLLRRRIVPVVLWERLIELYDHMNDCRQNEGIKPLYLVSLEKRREILNRKK